MTEPSCEGYFVFLLLFEHGANKLPAPLQWH